MEEGKEARCLCPSWSRGWGKRKKPSPLLLTKPLKRRKRRCSEPEPEEQDLGENEEGEVTESGSFV
jgi:hypothetical protein